MAKIDVNSSIKKVKNYCSNLQTNIPERKNKIYENFSRK